MKRLAVVSLCLLGSLLYLNNLNASKIQTSNLETKELNDSETQELKNLETKEPEAQGTQPSQALSFPETITHYNLLKNSSFESFSEGQDKAPDSWNISKLKISRDKNNQKFDSYAAKLTYKRQEGSLSQDLSDVNNLKAKTLFFGCWVKSSSPNQARISLDDGIAVSSSDYHSGSGDFEFLNLTATISDLATNLKVAINLDSKGTVYVDGACLYQLITEATYIPNPQDDLKMPSNLIFTDLENQKVGIGVIPDRKEDHRLEVDGNIKASGSIFSGDNELLTQISADELYINDQPLTGEETLTGNLNITGNLIVDDYLEVKTTSNPGIKVGDGTTGGYVQIGSAGWRDWYTEDEEGRREYYLSPLGTRNFYIPSTIHTTFIYSPDIFLGNTSGTEVYLRGNNLWGYNFAIPANGNTYFNNGGNVGIGIDSPSRKLHVVGDVLVSDGSGQGIFWRPDNAGHALKLGNGTNQYFGAHQFIDASGSNTRMVIQDGGNIGIGTTSPQEKLQVEGGVIINAAGEQGLKLSLYGGDSDLKIYRDNEVGDWSLLRCDAGNGIAIIGEPDVIALSVSRSNSNVGIGTTSPAAKLHIIGNNASALRVFDGPSPDIDDATIEFKRDDGWNPVTITSSHAGSYGGDLEFKLHPYDGLIETPPETKVIFKGNGNVGIGTTGPEEKWHVYGGGRTINTLIEQGSVAPYSAGIVLKAQYTEWQIANDGHDGNKLLFRDTTDDATRNPAVGGGERMVIDRSGNVGIGTTEPSQKLEVNGAVKATSFLKGDEEIIGSQWKTNNSDIYYEGGNVGIGTTSPHRNLTIVGTLSSAYSTIDESDIGLGAFDSYNLLFSSYGTTGSYKPLYVATGGQNRMAILSDGNVGIGTTEPSTRLHIVNGEATGATASYAPYDVLTIDDDSAAYINLRSPSTGTHSLSAILFSDNVRAQGEIEYQHIYDSSVIDKMFFSTNATKRMTIDGAGNVGIGTTSPETKLNIFGGQPEGLRIQSSGSGTPTNYLSFWNSDSVMGYIGYGSNEGTLYVTNELADKNIYLATKGAGDIIVGNGDIWINNGNINAKYQDVAEWVESEQELTPGTVVVIEPNSVNKVISSNSAYDSKVCGVVSHQPGLSLGEKGENKYQIAHTGRVKVKVDATFGKISQGDLLVTSSKEGVAMKYQAKDYTPGVVLGKALEPLDDGEGEILVLLSLQ